MWEEKELKDCALFVISTVLKVKFIFFFVVPIIHRLEMTLLTIEPQILEKFPSAELTIHEELMNSSDYFIITLLIKFISSCFDLQNNVINLNYLKRFDSFFLFFLLQFFLNCFC